MVYLVTGNKQQRKEFIMSVIHQYGTERSLAIHVHSDDLSDGHSLSEIVVTQSGLFGDIEFFVINDLARDLPLGSLLEDYKESKNIIFFSEASITKKVLNSFQKISAEIQEFSVEKKPIKSQDFNIFSLTDALGKRDKKNLWLRYTEALENASVEEINGVLLWQVKNMILVAKSTTPSVDGMKPFVFQKTQGFVKNYTVEELQVLMKDLTKAFHNRDTYNTLEVQVEKIILSL